MCRVTPSTLRLGPTLVALSAIGKRETWQQKRGGGEDRRKKDGQTVQERNKKERKNKKELFFLLQLCSGKRKKGIRNQLLHFSPSSFLIQARGEEEGPFFFLSFLARRGSMPNWEEKNSPPLCKDPLLPPFSFLVVPWGQHTLEEKGKKRPSVQFSPFPYAQYSPPKSRAKVFPCLRNVRLGVGAVRRLYFGSGRSECD